MSISGFVPDHETAATVVAWVQALAEPDEAKTFLCLESEHGEHTRESVRETLDGIGDSGAKLIAFEDHAPLAAILEQLHKTKSRLLVIGPYAATGPKGVGEVCDELARSAPCQTFALLFGQKTPADVRKILLVITAEDNDRSALRLVDGLRQRLKAQVTMAGVEDETGAAAGGAAGGYLRVLLHDAALDKDEYEIKVVVDRLEHRGVIALVEDHDLLVTGLDGASRVRPLREALGDTTAAVVKRPHASSRYGIADWLPRINPADHAELLYNLRIGSNWGPDFVGMLGLAAAIASLGLLQDSPAVVIGSMLLAPLMTPMIGLGLGLAQARRRLILHCGQSVVLGFLLTLAVSFLIGIVTPAGETLTGEVLARGGPNVLDLLIAVFAAAAATFALARPNITGAIAGVAIATALVPPICSSGISLAYGAWWNAFGAFALFFTNLVAIIVMSSFTFSFLGIGTGWVLPRHRRLTLVGRWSLVALLLLLAGLLSTALLEQIEEGKKVPLAHPVTRKVYRAVYERVDKDEGVEVMLIARPRAEHRVLLHIASEQDLPPSYADDLRSIVRQAMDEPEIPVTVIAVRGFWRSDDDHRETSTR
jgi:uncharacterized hydrophobic protein (TIGR00271 family)